MSIPSVIFGRYPLGKAVYSAALAFGWKPERLWEANVDL